MRSGCLTPRHATPRLLYLRERNPVPTALAWWTAGPVWRGGKIWNLKATQDNCSANSICIAARSLREKAHRSRTKRLVFLCTDIQIYKSINTRAYIYIYICTEVWKRHHGGRYKNNKNENYGQFQNTSQGVTPSVSGSHRNHWSETLSQRVMKRKGRPFQIQHRFLCKKIDAFKITGHLYFILQDLHHWNFEVPVEKRVDFFTSRKHKNYVLNFCKVKIYFIYCRKDMGQKVFKTLTVSLTFRCARNS